PDHFGIAPGVLDDGVLRVVGPGAAAVVGVSDALAAAGAREGRHQDVLVARLEAGRVLLVHHGAAGEAPVVEPAWGEGNRQLAPVDEVGADGVAPVHVAPVPAVGVVLVEQVIFALVIDQTVWIVQPTAARGEVELRAVSFLVNRVGAANVIALRDGGQAARVSGQGI